MQEAEGYEKMLDRSIEALKPFSNLPERTREYVAPIPYVADFAISLYGALANAIDGQCIRVHQLRLENFKHNVTHVNRCILVQFVSGIEFLLEKYCSDHGLKAESVYSKNANSLLEKCDSCLNSKLRSWLKRMVDGDQPSIGDYSDAILAHKGKGPDFDATWRNFLGFISVLRNKGAHGSVVLKKSDLEKIRYFKDEFNFEAELDFELKEGDDLQVPTSFLPWAFLKLQELATELDNS